MALYNIKRTTGLMNTPRVADTIAAHNALMWSEENPHAVRRRAAQTGYHADRYYRKSPHQTLPVTVSFNQT